MQLARCYKLQADRMLLKKDNNKLSKNMCELHEAHALSYLDTVYAVTVKEQFY